MAKKIKPLGTKKGQTRVVSNPIPENEVWWRGHQHQIIKKNVKGLENGGPVVHPNLLSGKPKFKVADYELTPCTLCGKPKYYQMVGKKVPKITICGDCNAIIDEDRKSKFIPTKAIDKLRNKVIQNMADDHKPQSLVERLRANKDEYDRLMMEVLSVKPRYTQAQLDRKLGVKEKKGVKKSWKRKNHFTNT